MSRESSGEGWEPSAPASSHHFHPFIRRLLEDQQPYPRQRSRHINLRSHPPRSKHRRIADNPPYLTSTCGHTPARIALPLRRAFRLPISGAVRTQCPTLLTFSSLTAVSDDSDVPSKMPGTLAVQTGRLHHTFW